MNQFQRFVIGRFGRDTWPVLVARAEVGLPDALLPVDHTYPDESLMAMVPVASEMTGIAVPELLEQFGTAIAPALLRVYAPLISPAWRTLDVIEHTERAIHRVVRQRRADAAPPELKVERTADDAISIDYRSHRRLCAVAVGIVRGLAAKFDERIQIEHRECMHRGDERCLIAVVRRTGLSAED
jgi:predicted hydrocarbon binding protein